MTRVKLASVRTFPSARPDKEHALKPLEEAAEVFGAWQIWGDCADEYDGCADECDGCAWSEHDGPCGHAVDVLDEIADTIQACCNLAASLGVTDLTPYLARCEERNRERGRYGE